MNTMSFLIDYYTKNADAVRFEARGALFEKLNEIPIPLSGLHKLLIENLVRPWKS